MAKSLKLRWEPTPGTGLSRRDRAGCEYMAHVPDTLSGRPVVLDGGIAADIADAEAAIIRLNAEATALTDSEILARLLLRAEAVASSRIEGLEVGARRLLRAEAAQLLGSDTRDVTAYEVLGNIRAMRWAVEVADAERKFTVADLLEIHRRLLEGTRMADHAGLIRHEQNWIGGSRFNPCQAVFVPPPPDYVRELLDDLCDFVNEESLPAVAQAAIAHAQFETIHPFADGNGRTGRALIHVVLRRRGLVPRVLPPVSLVLATWSEEYVARLTATRHEGPINARLAVEGLSAWLALFATACLRAVDDARAYETRIEELQTMWRARLGRVQRESTMELLLAMLPAAPIVTVTTAARLVNRTYQATNVAIQRLVDANVIRPVTVGRRNRAFEAPDVIEAFTDLERRLASPTGDTLIAPPVRTTPRR